MFDRLAVWTMTALVYLAFGRRGRKAAPSLPREGETLIDAQGASLIYRGPEGLNFVPAKAEAPLIDPKPPFSNFWRYALLLVSVTLAAGAVIYALGRLAGA